MRNLVVILSVAAALAIGLWFSTPAYTINAPAGTARAPQRPAREQPLINRLEDNRLLVERTGDSARAAFVPGEVLVKFRDPAAADEIVSRGATARGTIRLGASAALTAVFERFGVSRAGKPFASFKSASHRRIVKLISPALKDDPQRTEALAAELQNEPEVEYAELNLIMRSQAAPNDPYYSSSGAWGQPFRDLWGLQKISAEAAWETTRGENVAVAVIDTGVDYNHEDIAANIRLNPGETGSDGAGRDRKTNGVDDDRNGFVDDWRGWDFVTADDAAEDNDPMDDHGHGTHVAGTIAAVSGNGLGIAGVAPAAKIMALKGLNENGSGTTENLSKAILYAADNGARVINASWGVFARSPVQTLVESIDYAHDTKGVVFVAAAGNSGSDVGDQERGFSPANIRDAIAVSAFDNTDTRASFSNFGPKIDVAAPGGGDQDATGAVPHPGRSILSLLSSRASPDMTGSGALAVGARYLRQMGTSMASPHAAGVAALILARHPEYSPEQVRQALRQGSDDVGVSGPDPDSGRGRVNAARSLTVASPLAVQLTGPNGTLSGLTEVSVRGTAAGPGLLNWRLEYGTGGNPSSWTQIALSLTPVSEGQLALWDVSQLTDGTYTLRLTAQNNLGGTFEDRLTVRIDNIVITEPAYDPFSLEPVSFFRGGDVISIKGTVAPRNFSSYTIEVLDSSGRMLSGAKIALTNDGLQKVRDGVLGTWDTAGVPTDSYTIRLVVRVANVTFHETTHVIVDPSIHPGWPRSLGPFSVGPFSLALTNHLDAHDINGDGAKDLIVGYGNTVRILDHTGASLPGWPRRVDSITPDAVIQQSPAIGDLDGDGSPEIVAANNSSQIFIWRADGTSLPGWPRHFGGALNSLAVSDLNDDGVNEIIAADWAGRVKVFNKDGQYLPGWPLFLASDVLLPVCVADLDGDRQKEVVVATLSKQTQLFVIRSNGTIMPGWPQTINSWAPPDRGFRSYPAVGDLDGDRDSEIVVGSGDGKMHAFHHTGAVVSGWPRSTMASAVNSPAVGDLDGDGKAEVVAGIRTITQDWQRFNYLYAWHGDGTPLAGWPVKSDVSLGYFVTPYYGFGAPVIADVDGDRAPDIVASGDGTNFVVVRAYKADGSRVAGFPKAAFDGEAFPTNTVAIADLDNDGLLEMAWIDFSLHIYVWDLPSPADAPAPWPMFHHDARLTGSAPSAAGVSISGRVTHGAAGLGGVQVTLTSTSAGFPPLTVSTDATGSYSLTNLPRGATYTVKPSKLGYVFTPASSSYSNLNASKTGVNFSAAAASFSIGGKVTVGGAGLGGATVALSGSRAATATTLGDGSYRFADLPAGGSYTVKPSKAGHTFTPSQHTFESLGADRTADFNGASSAPTSLLQLSAASYAAGEGAGAATVTVTRTGDTQAAVSVNLATSDGTATAGADYAAAALTLNFAPGETSKDVPVPIINDTLDEPDETVNLTLSDPAGGAALGGRSTAVLTIADDDAPPSISVGDASLAEGDGGTTGATFNVTLATASGQTVTVNYATSNGTATAGIDYQAASGALTFNPGETSKTISVAVNGDTTDEPDETFFVDLTTPVNATVLGGRGVGTITNDDAPTVRFAAAGYAAGEALRGVQITVTREGDASGVASVSYATADGTATERKDYTAALGRLRFAPGETQKSFEVIVTDDRFDDDDEIFHVTLSNAVGAALGAQSTASVHITDNDAAHGPSPTWDATIEPAFFVQQHYADFLNRAPDQDGLNFWVGQATGCGASDPLVCRINVSAAFFLSIENQETGYLVHRAYKVSYGNLPNKPVPLTLQEYLVGSRRIGEGVQVGIGDWQQQLEANKQAFFAEFVTTSRFTSLYNGRSNAEFVDALNANSGGALSQAERDALVNALNGETQTRAQVLRAVAEDADFAQGPERNRAFVLAQYFGYLRRNPDDLDFRGVPDPNFDGYNFWLTKLNQFDGNFIQAEMVRAFIQSIEYGERFGQ